MALRLKLPFGDSQAKYSDEMLTSQDPKGSWDDLMFAEVELMQHSEHGNGDLNTTSFCV